MRKEEELYESLRRGHSIFRHIPEDIGEIMYCDSSNPIEKPTSMTPAILKIIFCVAIPLAVFYISDNNIQWTIAAAILAIALLIWILPFRGVDYFVGSEGAAEIKFRFTRDNTKVKRVIYFRDIVETATVLNETDRSNKERQYFFLLNGNEMKDGYYKNKRMEIGTIEQEDISEYIEDRKFRYLKKIDLYWSQYRFKIIKNSMANGEPMSFAYFDRKKVPQRDYLVFDGNNLVFKGEYFFDKSHIAGYEIYDGFLWLKYDNSHEDPAAVECQKVKILIDTISNPLLFPMVMDYFVKKEV